MKVRLDVLLVSRGLAKSREQAKAIIMEGKVFVKGEREDKAGSMFDEAAPIEIHGQKLRYVSRGGLKMEKAVAHFDLGLQDKVCMDVGSSTGGFTDCMLQNGARKVYAVDVGTNQLDWKLRSDPRVVSMEKTNIRYLTADKIDERPEFASIDVAFISLTKVLFPVRELLSEQGQVVALIKPQFEAGREKVGKKGVVREKSTHLEVIQMVLSYAWSIGFDILALEFSPIKGPEGNIEYLAWLKKTERETSEALPEWETLKAKLPDGLCPEQIVGGGSPKPGYKKKLRGTKRSMNRFYIITNVEKDPNFETTRKIQEYLKMRGAECIVREFQETKEADREGDYRYTDASRIPDGIECILVLGGDGTLIQAARDTVDRKIPLLGVNLGTLGYLAEIERSGIQEALDNLILDHYTIEPRMLLEGTVYRQGQKPVKNLALNDIVVNRAGALRIIDYEISVNGELLNRYSADGMIVSTPTGSTGYSLSAGGPIVSPMASMIVVTPICPHTLTARSIVLSGGDQVTIRTGAGKRNQREESFVSFDGEVQVPVATGDYVEIQKSEKTVNILKISRVSFLEVLRDKMRGN